LVSSASEKLEALKAKLLSGGRRTFSDTDLLAEARIDAAALHRMPVALTQEWARLTVTHGGGQLEMQIAKCDGAISEVYFSK